MSLEHAGDEVGPRDLRRLNSTFITPLDREDIRSLASDLDDILDYLEGVAQYLILFEIADARRRAAAPLRGDPGRDGRARSTRPALIWDMGNGKKIHESIVRISDLENEADSLYFGVCWGALPEGSAGARSRS